jgi:hypothetical protein
LDIQILKCPFIKSIHGNIIIILIGLFVLDLNIICLFLLFFIFILGGLVWICVYFLKFLFLNLIIFKFFC